MLLLCLWRRCSKLGHVAIMCCVTKEPQAKKAQIESKAARCLHNKYGMLECSFIVLSFRRVDGVRHFIVRYAAGRMARAWQEHTHQTRRVVQIQPTEHYTALAAFARRIVPRFLTFGYRTYTVPIQLFQLFGTFLDDETSCPLIIHENMQGL